MIIVCPECSTKFNVNAERIPAGGTKVRCARCKHVFPVQVPVPEAPVETEVESVQDDPVTPVAFDEPATDESSFSYDKFQELDSAPATDDNFSFSGKPETENDFSFSDETEEPIGTIEKVVAATEDEKKEGGNSESAIVEATIDQAEKTPEALELPAEPEFPSSPVAEKKGGPVAAIIRILLLLILAILIIGGVFVYMNGTDQLNQTIQQIFGQQNEGPVQTGQITLSELEGKFFLNDQAGELFLIRGEAINNFGDARAAIQVKGVIFDQNGKPLLQKTVFCGNAIGDHELQTLSFAELEKIMGNQFGKELSNMKIASKQHIPFDIIFKDLPKNLAEFSVKVTSSQPASK